MKKRHLHWIKYLLQIKRFVFLFIIASGVSLPFGCKQMDDRSNVRDKTLDGIEAQMFQQPENLDSVLVTIDTTNITPYEQARIGTIRGLSHFENGDYVNSIKELEKAEIFFFNQRDDYHLNICKLVKAFTFEYLNLDQNAASLFVECENYFDVHHLEKFKFYATLGLYRMAKPLNLDEKALLDRLNKAAVQFNDLNYYGLLYSTIGGTEKNDSLSLIYYERAKSYFSRAHRWSRVYAIEINLLFVKIRQDHSENAQKYYDNFPNKTYLYSPTVHEQMRYKYAQAYLYAKQGKDKQSIEVANKVLNEAVAFKITKVESDCVLLLTYLYKRSGDFKNAHAMIERHNAMKETEQKSLQQIRLLVLGAHYRYSELEREKSELRAKVQKSLFLIGAIILVFIFVISIVLLSLKKSKYKQEILKLKNRKIEEQISNLLISLHLDKNENEKLIRQTEDLGNQYADSIKVSEFLEAIEQNQIITWTVYEATFHDLRPGWVEKLKQTVPGLSSTDLNYCMCIYFNLKNKTMMIFFNIGNEAIKSAKKRIRDKFSLADAKEIYTFLNDLV
jgi:hypothetical protein